MHFAAVHLSLNTELSVALTRGKLGSEAIGGAGAGDEGGAAIPSTQQKRWSPTQKAAGQQRTCTRAASASQTPPTPPTHRGHSQVPRKRSDWAGESQRSGSQPRLVGTTGFHDRHESSVRAQLQKTEQPVQRISEPLPNSSALPLR